jgi:heavy metal translocating P-type ATPase
MLPEERLAAIGRLAEERGEQILAIAGVFAGQGMVFSLALSMTPPPFASPAYLLLHGGPIFSSVVVMAFLGGPLFASTWAMLRLRRLSIEGLFTLSLLGAFVGSVVGSISGRDEVFYEVVAIVIAIYTFGRMLGERSQARLKLESMRLRERFDRACVEAAPGQWAERPVAEVAVGSRVRVEPGAAFAVDGVLLEGLGYVQETSLTGEPLPVVRRPGDWVRAGTWALDSRFILEVGRSLGSRELDTILEMVEGADGRPSDLQTQANNLIRIFLPIVVGVSLATALAWGLRGSWLDAVLHSMAVLLVACPCALGLATPVAISQGLFRLAQMGLVSRDGALIDALARTRKVFFDKTGTLSEASLRVAELWVSGTLPVTRRLLLDSVFGAEMDLRHPVARALSNYLEAHESAKPGRIEDLRLVPGQGLQFRLHGPQPGAHWVEVGESSLGGSPASLETAAAQLHEKRGKRVFVWIDGEVVACFVLQESLREGVDAVWSRLEALGVGSHILTGDPLPEVRIPDTVTLEAGLSSADKVHRVAAAYAAGESPLFVGDGINDAASMRRASGSVAMGSGTGLARSAAMGQLVGDHIEVLPLAIALAREIHQRLRGNLIYAAAYNMAGMTLAAAGLLHPVAAAVIMLVSSFWVTTRALGRGDSARTESGDSPPTNLNAQS